MRANSATTLRPVTDAVGADPAWTDVARLEPEPEPVTPQDASAIVGQAAIIAALRATWRTRRVFMSAFPAKVS